MRLALFGGTFDPIHTAHLAVAGAACEECALDEVWLIPASNPPHKPGEASAPFEDRYRMAELACEPHPHFRVSQLEEGPERSYSIETIERVQAMLGPADRLFFLIGADAFADVATWRRWRDVVRSVEFIVAARPGSQYPVPEGARVYRLDSTNSIVSSSAIRKQLARGEKPSGLPEPVYRYIQERGLYRTGEVTES